MFVDHPKCNMKELKDPSSGIIEKPKGLGIRHLEIFLVCTGLMIAFALMANLSFAIVSMVDNSYNPGFQKYDWNESIRGLILSSLYWGYATSPLIAGLLAQRFGAKILLIISSGLSGVLTLLLPSVASFGWEYVCTLRMLLGFFIGFYTPCVHALLAKWVHPSERGILASLTYSALPAGILIMLALSGVIAESPIGWPGIFYSSGSLSVIWSVVWIIYGSNSPAEYKNISAKERAFIESKDAKEDKRSFATPWKDICTSLPFWALFITYCTEHWAFFTLMAVVPSYMNGVLNFDIESNALFSAVPYLVMLIVVIIGSITSDYFINNRYISVAIGRKIFNTIGMWIPAVCYIGLGFVNSEHVMLAVTILTIGLGASGAVTAGYMINHLDISPNFAGTLMGITDGFGMIVCMMGPLFVGYIVYDVTDPHLWRIFFIVTSGFLVIGNMVFITFGKVNIQYWNKVI